jgi:rhodanese-related sulfurtransferase
MSFFGGSEEGAINKEAMTKIIEEVSATSREESGYVIIDVRGHDEIASTGKLNNCVETLPLPNIPGGLVMEEEDFKAEFGFDKPGLDETIVFSCKAGVRAKQAYQLAKNAGYSKVIYYAGGSNEWFS